MRLVKNFGLREAFIGLLIAGLSISTVKYFVREAGVWQTIKVEVVGNDWTVKYYEQAKPPFWLSEKIKAGDSEKGVDGSKIAEVVRVENYEKVNEETDIYLTVKVKTELNQKLGKYVYKGRSIAVGELIELRLNRVLINGQIIDDQVPDEGYNQKEVIIRGRWKDQEPWRVGEVKAGDKMIDRGSGRAVAEILTAWIEPATNPVAVNFATSERLAVHNSQRWIDGMARVKLLVEEHDGGWFFGGHQKVKVGKYLMLYLSTVDVVNMEIEAIEPVD